VKKILFLLLAFAALNGSAHAQARKPAENAALRYWAAFAQLQDAAIDDATAKQISRILAGTSPYSDNDFAQLVEKNEPALQTMIRGTALPYCDWAIDYALGPDTPVEYVRDARELGRLNVLYARHLQLRGDMDGAVRAMTAGMRFARDVANGGTLFAALTAKSLLSADVKTAQFFLEHGQLDQNRKAMLTQDLASLGNDGLDWAAAARQEMNLDQLQLAQLREAPQPRALYAQWFGHAAPEGFQLNADTAHALDQISSAYVKLFSGNTADSSAVQRMIDDAPSPIREMVPSPTRMVQARDELRQQIALARDLARRK
jgi:hypothetical protein